MKKRSQTEHGPRHVTPAGRSVFRDLFSEIEAAELEIRAALLQRFDRWLASSNMTQVKAAKVLGITQARVSDIKRGKINQFSMDRLVRLAVRAGLRPKLNLPRERDLPGARQRHPRVYWS